MYTVSRVDKKDRLFGSIHGSRDSYVTNCGKKVDENWWIVTNDSSGVITCKKCLAIKQKKRS